ncbi:MAG: peptidylprolyl isomerase [Myxococcota bacterium]|nr:peptidylprolyl isomerase [Myxococcota bacterium]
MTTLMLLCSLATAAPDADTLTTLWQVQATRGAADPVLPLLSSQDADTRFQATLTLARLRDPALLPQLQAQLADPDLRVQQAAAFGLGLTEGGGPLALEALQTAQAPALRARLFEALGMHAEVAGVPLLVAGLSEAPEAAQSAAEALGRMGLAKVPEVSVPAVTDALAEQLDKRWLAPQVRVAVAYALARIAPDSLSSQAAEIFTAHADTDPSAAVRSLLMRGLIPSTPDPKALLEAGLQDADRGVRIATARAAAKAGEDGIPALEILLHDPAWDVQLAAVEASGAVAGLDHEALLTPLLEEANLVDLRAAAATALGKTGHTDALRPYLDRHQPLPLRVAVVGTLEDSAQLLRLLEKSADQPAAIRSSIAARLAELEAGPEIALALLQNPDPAVVAVGLSMLGESEDPEHLGAVLEALSSAEDLDVWREGLGALESLLALLPSRAPVPAAAADRVQEALNHPDLSVRQAAASLGERLELQGSPPEPTLPDPEAVGQILGARVITDAGVLMLSFDTELAPLTVWNFVTLAEADYFDGQSMHRVVPDFVAQTGCPRGDGWGGPGHSIPDELSWAPYSEGTVGMALSGPDTGGSQWFVTLSDQPHLEAGYTVFGQLVGGSPGALHQGAQVLDVVIERRE